MAAPPPITAADALAGYLKTVVPRGTQDEIEGASLAFMSGLWFMLKQMHDYIGDPATTEDDGERYLTALKHECEAFIEYVSTRARPPDPRSCSTCGSSKAATAWTSRTSWTGSRRTRC